MKRKNLLTIFLTMALCITMLGGCTTTNESPKTGNDTDAKETDVAESNTDEAGGLSGEPIEITWGLQRQLTEDSTKAYEKVAQVYNETNDKGITVSINFVEYTDDAQWSTWLTSQLIGGVCNEVVLTWHTEAIENYKKELIIDLQPFLNEQNPYNSSNEIWIDTFTEGLINQNMDSITGVIPSVPLATTAVKVFYNKDLFNDLGITTLPKTYSELIATCKIIQENSVAPFIVANQSPSDNHFNWFHRMFMDQTIEPLIEDMDMSGNGIIELNEICAGFDKGLINLEDDRYMDILPILKDFSEYWYPGYNGIDSNTATDLFIRQDGAMIMSLGMSLKTYLENPDLDFEVGYFSFPYLTSENTEYAVEKLYEMGGAPQSNMCIPASVSGDKLSAAIDFLQFLSSEQGAALMAEELWFTPPFKTVANMPGEMEGMYIEGSTSKLRLLAPQTDQLLYQDDTKLGQLFLEGSIDAAEFGKSLNEDLRISVEALKSANNWNEENNWGLDE